MIDDTATGDRGALETRPLESCFHCGEPLIPGSRFSARIDGVEQPMCCPGCKAVAEAIVGAGHDHFYRVRDGHTPGASSSSPVGGDSAIFDRHEIQQRYVHQLDENTREVSLILEGISCAACSWLIERYLGELPGVLEVRVNYATHHALLRWNPAQAKLLFCVGSCCKDYYKGARSSPLTRKGRTIVYVRQSAAGSCRPASLKIKKLVSFIPCRARTRQSFYWLPVS